MTTTGFSVVRTIEIDAGHRVATHGSKCQHKHGHRYKIEAEVSAKDLGDQGTGTGMVMDFGFLKDIMMKIINDDCDHTFIVWSKDDRLIKQFGLKKILNEEHVIESLKHKQHAIVQDSMGNKIYMMDNIPTAENLAMHWYFRLRRHMHQHGFMDKAGLERITVWETPNCTATYPVQIP